MNPATRTGALIALVMLLLAGVVWVDCATGVEISVFFLYFIPAVAATWLLGLRYGLAVALLATSAHRWADRANIVKYSHSWIFWEKGASGFLILGFVVYSFHTFKLGRKADRERIRRLEELLHACPSCSRIRQADGGWKNFATCLRELNDLPPEKRLCPECAAARELQDYSL
jgi:hypothetical protein